MGGLLTAYPSGTLSLLKVWLWKGTFVVADSQLAVNHTFTSNRYYYWTSITALSVLCTECCSGLYGFWSVCGNTMQQATGAGSVSIVANLLSGFVSNNTIAMWGALRTGDQMLINSVPQLDTLTIAVQALRYFLDQGVEAVVGVDLALMAIERNAAVNFPMAASTTEADAVTFTQTKQVLECGGNLPAAVTFTITSNAAAGGNNGGGVATLVAGSLFDVPLAKLLGGRVDLIYDRASMVALPPDLRGAYVNTLASLRPSLVILELVRRRRDPPEALLNGPPFDIPVEDVTRLYSAAAAAATAGSESADDSPLSPLRLVTVDDAAAMAFAAGTPLEGDSLDVLPPFRFALYALTTTTHTV